MSAIAVIPARGGSKRIPRKNIREFAGKPMLAWPIMAAQASGCFERVIVSTDDEEIAELAVTLGVEVPFQRPAELADDHAPTAPVIAHAIQALEADAARVDVVCCIYPTAPFLKLADLREAKGLMSNADADFVVPVTEFGFPIQRAVIVDEQARLQMLQPEHRLTRSQDLPTAYHDAGQFYFGRRDAWLDETPLFGSRTRALVLPRWRVQDIDTLADWRRAELMFAAMQQGEYG